MRIALKESDVTKVVIDWLSLQPGVRVWRQNTGGMLREYKGKTRLIKFGVPGMPDLAGVKTEQYWRVPEIWPTQMQLPLSVARSIFIEVKRPGKKPAPEQQAFLDDMRERGAIAFYCDSLEMCQEKWSEQNA